MPAFFVVGRTTPIRGKYSLGAQIGQPGQFGLARAAVDLCSGKEFAVKIISKARFERVNDKQGYFEMLKQEVCAPGLLPATRVLC